MAEDGILTYLKNGSGNKAFFYIVGNEEYEAAVKDLKALGFEIKNIVDFCGNEDKFPNFDKLIDDLKTADINFSNRKYALVGMGEYLVLRGNQEADSKLRALWATGVGSARVVVVLRFVRKQVEDILDSDIRLRGQNRTCFRGCDFQRPTLVKVSKKRPDSFVKDYGIKYLIEEMGKRPLKESFRFSSDLDLSDAEIDVTDATDSFSMLKLLTSFRMKKSYGDVTMWDRLLDEVYTIIGGDQYCELSNLESTEIFHRIFYSHKLDTIDVESNFFKNSFRQDDYSRWLYFLMLKMYADNIRNVYLKSVINDCDDSSSFKDRFIKGILYVYNSDVFDDYYEERKKLLKGASNADMERFVCNDCAADPVVGMHCLTDNTPIEKEAIIRWIYDYGDNSDVRTNYFDSIIKTYPDLASYMETYEFDCGDLSKEFTDYFNRYKRQKLANKIDDDFHAQLTEHSKMYARLDSRSNVFQLIKNKESSYLLWIDAMGVEFLSFIQYLASVEDLSVHIYIARANLPSITEYNKDFYYDWDPHRRGKEGKLDEILHGDNKGQDYIKVEAPIYLASELEIIKKAIEYAKSLLEDGEYTQVIIASDHGASRLAVICEDVQYYGTDASGEHSGRCCKAFDCNDENVSDIENGYISRLDYNRFKGGRKASVEVHGGETLEEAVIPIITLTKRTLNNYEVNLVNREIKINLNNGITFDLYIGGVTPGKAVEVRIHKDGKKYECETKKNQESSYRISCPYVKHAGKYIMDIYVGGEKIESMRLDVKGATGSSNLSFDNLF